jgi:hypothetical protein
MELQMHHNGEKRCLPPEEALHGGMNATREDSTGKNCTGKDRGKGWGS